MDLDSLMDSIAAKAPSMRTNDTVHAGPGVYWRVVAEEKTSERHMVESDLLKVTATTSSTWNTVEFWYGTALSVWCLVACFLVVLALLCRDRRFGLLLFKRKTPTTRWFVVNLIGLQLITAAMVLIVPSANRLSDDERDSHDITSTRWRLGSGTCRVWLLGRMWLSAATMWAAFGTLFDRFLGAVAPIPYDRWMGSSEGCRATILAAVGVLATWVTAATALVPTWISLDRNEFILEEVCAINLSSVNALYVTMSSYVVPSSLVIVTSLALVIARRRAIKTSKHEPLHRSQVDNYTRLGLPRDSLSHDYDVISDCTGEDCNETGCGIACATSWLCVLGWLPFHSLGVTVALCGILSTSSFSSSSDVPDSSSHHTSETPMCIDPGVWTLFNWVGYTATLGVLPVVWLVGDRVTRTRLVGLFSSRYRGAAGTLTGSRSSASSTCATDLSSNGSRRRLDDGSTL